MDDEDHKTNEIRMLRDVLTSYAGKRILLHSRFFFIARVDEISLDEKGLRLTAEAVEAVEDCPFNWQFPKEIRWSASIKMISPHRGSIAAHYVSFSIYYDASLNEAVLSELDSRPPSRERAIKIINDWLEHRDAAPNPTSSESS